MPSGVRDLSVPVDCLTLLKSELRCESGEGVVSSSSLMNLTLHSELRRDDSDISLPRLLANELLRLGLETVMIGRFAVDGVGVGGRT